MEDEEKIFNSDDCVICYERLRTINTMIFPCGHKCVHSTCFANSVVNTGKLICPICRFDLVTNSPPQPPPQSSSPPLPLAIGVIGGMGIVSLMINGIRIPLPVSPSRGIFGMEDDDELPPLEEIPIQPPSPPPINNIRERRTTSVQCQATTLGGQRCKKRTREQNGYCYSHRHIHVN
jgi:Ring finger domain/Family of unknown function (DUF5763)